MEKQFIEIPQVDVPDEVTQVDLPEIGETTPHPTPADPQPGAANEPTAKIGFARK